MLLLYVGLFLAIVLEAFPISSSGHIKMFMSLFSLVTGQTVDGELFEVVDHFSHLIIALGLVLFFFKRVTVYLKNGTRSIPLLKKIIFLGVITDTITVAMYVLTKIYDITWFPLPLGFLITALLLYSLKFVPNNRVGRTWDLVSAILLGCVQGLALLPGISRFASTFVVARWYGIRSERAFELSFLIEFPISVAGGLLGIFYMHQHGLMSILLNVPMLVVMLSAGGLFIASLYLMQHIIKIDRMWAWSYYVAVVAVIAALLRSKGIV